MALNDSWWCVENCPNDKGDPKRSQLVEEKLKMGVQLGGVGFFLRGIVRADREDTERGELEKSHHCPGRNDSVKDAQAVDVFAPQNCHPTTDSACVLASAQGR